MSNANNNDKTSKLSEEERLKQVQENFDKAYLELKRSSWKQAPCVRATFLTSIPSSFIIGVVTYIATSRARLASHLTVGSFALVTAGYFYKCRKEFDEKLKQNKELGELMDMIIKYRGTEMEGQLQKRYKEKVEEMDTKAKYV